MDRPGSFFTAFKNLDYLVRSVNNRVIYPGEQYPGPIGTSEVTTRTVYADDRVYHTGDAPQTTSEGKKSGSRKWISVFDRSQTVTIEEGNSAMVHQGRFEHHACFPSHTWSLKHLKINFPLSDYLQGAVAMNANSKVRDLSHGLGVRDEKIAKQDINRVEVEAVSWKSTAGC